jgi:DNA-binding XRE family transcriptional regulator
MDMDLAQLLAKNLRARRGDMTQEVFARKLGISRATLTRLESASQNTTITDPTDK